MQQRRLIVYTLAGTLSFERRAIVGIQFGLHWGGRKLLLLLVVGVFLRLCCLARRRRGSVRTHCSRSQLCQIPASYRGANLSLATVSGNELFNLILADLLATERI